MTVTAVWTETSGPSEIEWKNLAESLGCSCGHRGVLHIPHLPYFTFRPHWVLGFTQPLTETSTRNIKIIMFLGSKVRRVRKADNFTAICEPTLDNVESLTSQSYRPRRRVTGTALLYGDGVCFLWGTNWTVSTATSSQYLAVSCEPTV
jgi:hypothetical protein